MSKVTGLLNFIAQAPGQVFGGLLGPSPLPPGLAGQLPPGYEEQARQQAIQQMAISALSAPRGQQLAQATQAGQTGYRSSLVDMLRMREMERMQGEREKEAQRIEALRGMSPAFANMSPQSIEQVMVDELTFRPTPVKPAYNKGDIRKYDSGEQTITEEYDGESWNVIARGPRWESDAGSGKGGAGRMTELDKRTLSFLERMNNARGAIGGPDMEAQFGIKSFANVKDRLATSAAEQGGLLGEVAQTTVSEPYRAYLNNAREWISGLLRYDSGAAVPETEFNRYFLTYFAVPGDTPEVIAEKARKRLVAEQGMRLGLAGGGQSTPSGSGSGGWSISLVEE